MLIKQLENVDYLGYRLTCSSELQCWGVISRSTRLDSCCSMAVQPPIEHRQKVILYQGGLQLLQPGSWLKETERWRIQAGTEGELGRKGARGRALVSVLLLRPELYCWTIASWGRKWYNRTAWAKASWLACVLEYFSLQHNVIKIASLALWW